MSETETAHVHDVGSTGKCACGWVLVIPPIYCSIEVGYRSTMLINEAFNCDNVGVAIIELERAIRKLRRYEETGKV